MAGLLSFAAVGFTACSNDDPEPEIPVVEDNKEAEFSNNFFSIENGSFQAGALPEVTDGEPITGLSMNDRALTGGMNFVTIQTEKSYESFLVGIKGQEGYWNVKADSGAPAQVAALSRGYNTYIIPISFGTGYSADIVIIIIAVDGQGNMSSPTEGEVDYVESKSGDLNINLTFSNAKDVDLHLITPSGRRIYYGDRGGYYTVVEEDGSVREIEFGLDHDSNAACRIDNLNNENIFIPAELVEAGIYTIQVDMYSNCNDAIATSWAIVARYQDNIVTPLTGANPAAGVYPVGAGEGDHSEVMTFELKPKEAAAAAKAPMALKKRQQTPSAIEKLGMLDDQEKALLGIN